MFEMGRDGGQGTEEVEQRKLNVSGGVLLSKPRLAAWLPDCLTDCLPACLTAEAKLFEEGGGHSGDRSIGTRWKFVQSRLTGSGSRLRVHGKN